MFNYLTSNAYPSPHTGTYHQIIKSMWIHYLFPISVPKNMPNNCPDPHLEDNPTNRDWLLTSVSPRLRWLSHSWPLSVNTQFRFAGCSKFRWSVSGNPSTASFHCLKSTIAWSSNLIFRNIPWFMILPPNFPSKISKSPVFPQKNQQKPSFPSRLPASPARPSPAAAPPAASRPGPAAAAPPRSPRSPAGRPAATTQRRRRWSWPRAAKSPAEMEETMVILGDFWGNFRISPRHR